MADSRGRKMFEPIQNRSSRKGNGQLPSMMAATGIKCICHRPTTTVFCTNCREVFAGRVCTSCPVHPNVCFFQDKKVCTNCKMDQRPTLMELDEDILRRINSDKKH